jgi:hypothetical protein
VFLEGQPHQISADVFLDGLNHTFSIPEEVVPMNATEVQLLSFVRTGNVESALIFVRVSTTQNGRVYPFYQKVFGHPQNAISYDSMIHWYPIDTATPQRNVTFWSSASTSVSKRGFGYVFVTAYRV